MSSAAERLSKPERSGARKKSRSTGLKSWIGRKRDDEQPAPVDITHSLGRVLRQTPIYEVTNDPQLESTRAGLAAIEEALYAIDAVRSILEEACDVVLSAKDVEDAAGRALLAERYDELRLSIEPALEKAAQNGGALFDPNARPIDVRLNEKAHYAISPVRLDLSEKGLPLPPPADAFAHFDEIATVLEKLDYALWKTDRAAADYCQDARFLTARLSAYAAAAQAQI